MYLHNYPFHYHGYSLSESGWSVKGVTTEKVIILGDVAIVECSSLHLTSFACLVDVGGAQVISQKTKSIAFLSQ